MKLGTLKEGGRDGTLIVVSRDLSKAVKASGIAATLQRALEDWESTAPRLNSVYEALNLSPAKTINGEAVFALDFAQLADGAQLVAIAGVNGRGKSTVMDNMHPYLTMPSRAAMAGPGGFSYYEHVCLPENEKDLIWTHDGRRYRSQVVIRVNGRRKTEAFLFELATNGLWQPVVLEDGTVSDGKVDPYTRCVEALCGSAETFFTSVFSAQGKRQLSAYRNAEVKTLLAPAGKLILSIPNPTHMGVVFGLLNGHFARTTEGLLDETHVQFLDRQGLEALVRRTGYRINRCDDVRKGLLDTEFALLDTLGVPATVRSYVSTLPDSDTYQFVWVLEQSAQEEIQTAALEIRKPLPPRFAAQLFVDYGAGFDEAKSCFAWGEMNEAVQTLVFSNLCLSGASRLRLDFCDRPGLFEFFSLQFFDPHGTCLGTWSGDWFSELTLNDCQWTASAGERGGRLVRALSNDPWIQMPVMAEVWQHAIRAELKMSAPVKYLDIAFGLAHQHLLKLENTCMQQAHALEHLQMQIDAMQAQLVSTQAQLATTEIAKEQAEKWAYQRLSELAQLHSQLDTIRNSNAYRLLETLRLAPQKKDSNV